MWRLVWGVEGQWWMWRWRRRLFVWEEEQVLFLIKLFWGASFVVLFFAEIFLLQNNMTDKWIWKHDTHEGYSVKGVYHIVNQNKQQDHAPFTELIWNKTMSLKCLFLRGELYIRGFRDQRQFGSSWEVVNSCSLLCFGGCRKGRTYKSFVLFFRLMSAWMPFGGSHLFRSDIHHYFLGVPVVLSLGHLEGKKLAYLFQQWIVSWSLSW